MIVGAVCDRNDEVGALPFNCFVGVLDIEELLVKFIWLCSHHISIDNRSIIFPQDILERVEKIGFFIYDRNQSNALFISAGRRFF